MKCKRTPDSRRTAAQMHALAAVRRDIGSHISTGPRKYLREFTQAFRKYDGALSEAEFNTRLAAAGTILVGDYHALPASQKYAAELIQRIASTRQVVLGVEAVLSRDQSILDAWWRREIATSELRERLRFDRDWGYHWDPFYDLLTTARDGADGAYGLDCLPRHDMRRIRSRDKHAAEQIAEMRARHPKAALVVLFGESHLAPEHMPSRLAQVLPNEHVLTVLQNLDSIYWQALKENDAAVSLGREAVCVFNSTPLEKYENYRLCLEKWRGDDAPDFTPAVHNLILSLARAVGFRTDSPHNGTQPKNLTSSLPEVVYVTGDALNPENTRAGLEEPTCAYLPQTNTFLVREFQMAEVAAEAARFLHHACVGMPHAYQSTSRARSLAHFGSRLLCPGNQPDGVVDATGESLYQDYLKGKITPGELRLLFLSLND